VVQYVAKGQKRSFGNRRRFDAGMRPQKITFGDMREMGVQGVLICRADYHCSHSVALSADRWPDELRLSDLELRLVCRACGRRGADIRPDFNWNKPAPALEERHWSRPYPRLPGPFILPARPAARMRRKARTSSDKWFRRARG
jgi:hypothetical protein